MKKMAHSIRSFAFLMCIVVLGGMFIYYQFMNREQAVTDDLPKTESERLMAKDLVDGYPEYPNEVMELYGRYLQYMYNNKIPNNEFKTLVEQIRMMYHSDLITKNPLDDQTVKMQEEVTVFLKNRMKITTCNVDTKVERRKIDGRQCALLNIVFLISTTKGYTRTYESFILSQEDEKWKIIGFKQTEGGNNSKIGGLKE